MYLIALPTSSLLIPDAVFLFILLLKTRAGVAVWVGGKSEAATDVFRDGKSWGHGLLR